MIQTKNNPNPYPQSTSTTITKILILSIFLITSLCGPVLDNNQIIFQMTGTTIYIPDSGGLSRNGYKMTVGYTGKQWLGVQIVTSTDKNDVLIFQLNQFYSEGSTPLRTGHQITVTDYYRTGDTLNYDQNTEYDISAFSYSQKKQFKIDLTRYIGSNSGQDWNAAANGYTLLPICFYTSNNLFDRTTWNTGGFSQCYYFQIDGYYSEFKGVKLKSFYVNGYSTGIYGWIDGPYVSNNVYIYHKVPLFTYTKQPAVIIEIGTTTGSVGQDFNAYSPIESQCGDYYGASVTSMVKDNTRRGGYQNSGLIVKNWNAVPANQITGLSFTAIRVNYKRNITTFDSYDRQLKSTFVFCMYMYGVGSISSDLTDKSCQMVELSYHYVRAVMPDKNWERYMGVLVWVWVGVILFFGLL